MMACNFTEFRYLVIKAQMRSVCTVFIRCTYIIHAGMYVGHIASLYSTLLLIIYTCIKHDGVCLNTYVASVFDTPNSSLRYIYMHACMRLLND